jgi:hypothetical protein
LIEILIAVCVSDSFVHLFVSDVLVVILVCCFIQSFWKIQPFKAIAEIFVFAPVTHSHMMFGSSLVVG